MIQDNKNRPKYPYVVNSEIYTHIKAEIYNARIFGLYIIQISIMIIIAREAPFGLLDYLYITDVY